MPTRCLIAAALLAALPASAQEASPEPLPDPLTLVDALRLARDDHPDIERAIAERMGARSRLDLADSRDQWNAWIDLDARTVDKASRPGSGFIDDSRAGLGLTRLLSDFGESRAASAAAAASLAGAEQAVAYREALHRIDIMERFFDARLADLRYFVDDEDMTLSFLRYDRVRDRREKFNEYTKIRELELESEFRRRLVVRERASNRQRAARNALALAMGRPHDLADHLQTPGLEAYQRPQPDYDELLAQILDAHPLLAVNRMRIEASRRAIERYRLSDRPELSARLEANEWSLETGNRDQYVAGLELRVPLGGTPAKNARVAMAQAEKYRLQAERRTLEFDIRQRVLERVQRLRELELAAEAADVDERFRDLYLDRSRTLYQLEVRTDLGDSQARQAEALWRSAQVAFERARIWARLDAMRGLPLAVMQSGEQQ